jgi:hypothetical protein
VTDEQPDSNQYAVALSHRRPRVGGRIDRNVAISVVLLTIPIVAYLYMVIHFGVNVVFADQWSDVQLLAHHYDGSLSLSNLWTQHNENRMLIPNLVVLLLAETTRFNIATQDLLSAMLLTGTVLLTIYGHHRRAKGLTLWTYLPVVVLMVSAVQQENSLWGFQIAWYLVLSALIASLVVLDAFRLDWMKLSVAILLAVVASYSSFQGLLVWPAALVLLYHRRRAPGYWIAWAAASVAVIVFYFYNYRFSPHGSFARDHPIASLKFFFYAIGQIFGVPQAFGQRANLLVLASGVVIFALATITILLYGVRRDERGSAPFGVAIALVGLAFSIIITQGRDIFGYWAASASRYTTMELLIPIGTYLALLGRLATDRVDVGDRQTRPFRDGLARLNIFRVLLVGVGFFMVAQAVIGNMYGVAQAQKRHSHDVIAQRVLSNIDTVPDAEIAYLSPFGDRYRIRMLSHTLERHHLVIFSP